MNILNTLLHSLDRAQRSTPVLAFPLAVVKRYSDEKTGRKAALLTYYAFLSLFPLIIVFVSILGFLISNNAGLESQIMRHVFQFFPTLGSQIKTNVSTLHSSGIALLLQVFVVLYGARGLASILQETFNDLWQVLPEHRPGFWGDHIRSIGMMMSVGLGIIIGTVVSYSLNSVVHLGFIGALFVTVINAIITYGLFLTVFRMGTSDRISLRKLGVGAAIATIGTILVQRFGGYIMSHELTKLEGSYGSFAFALGVMFWLYLQIQIILYAIVITVVRTEHDWPKKLF
jgi:membrane protein